MLSRLLPPAFRRNSALLVAYISAPRVYRALYINRADNPWWDFLGLSWALLDGYGTIFCFENRASTRPLAMHLMYYLSESGERVYTLKARAAAAPALCCAATDRPPPPLARRRRRRQRASPPSRRTRRGSRPTTNSRSTASSASAASGCCPCRGPRSHCSTRDLFLSSTA